METAESRWSASDRERAQQIETDMAAWRRRRTVRRWIGERLWAAGCAVGILGAACACVGIYHPEAARWPLAVCLMSAPALLIAGEMWTR